MIKTGKYLDKSIPDLTKLTVEGVLQDANISKDDIQSVHFGNCGWGYFQNQHLIRGQISMRACGIDRIPITNHEAACATASLALHSAVKDILTGMYDCSLAVGVEKLVNEDKIKAMEFFSAAVPNYTEEIKKSVFENFNRVKELITDVEIPDYDQRGRSAFMDLYATIGLAHMQRNGTTMEDYAHIAAKNHTHSQHNPLAQYQFPMTVEEVMNDYIVSYPLTRSMCAPISDGAASALVCSEEYYNKLPKDIRDRAVIVRASVFTSGFIKEFSEDVELAQTSVLTANQAYEMAGIKPSDIDVAEVHDATAIGELAQYENLGFCEKGKGGEFVRSGATKLGGTLPVNTSGGLESRGHPIGASGLCMIHEIVTQLRGEAGKRQVENAKIGLTENGGGVIDFDDAACSIHILEKA